MLLLQFTYKYLICDPEGVVTLKLRTTCLRNNLFIRLCLRSSARQMGLSIHPPRAQSFYPELKRKSNATCGMESFRVRNSMRKHCLAQHGVTSGRAQPGLNHQMTRAKGAVSISKHLADARFSWTVVFMSCGWCLACISVFALLVCLVSTEVQRGHKSPWN